MVFSKKRTRVSKFFFIFLACALVQGLPVGSFSGVKEAHASYIPQYSGGIVVYADAIDVGTPKYKVFDDASGFGTEQSASSVGSSAIDWIRVAASPTRPEWIIATRDSSNVIKAQVCTDIDGGIACGTPTTITSTGGTHGFENFDVAYEQTSGDALLVYGTATADELRKIEWSGGAWSNDASITTTRTLGTVEWVELTSRPGTDEIGIAYADSGDDVSAYKWSGTSVGNEATSAITTGASTSNTRKVDISFEGTSGTMVVASPLATAGTTAVGKLTTAGAWTIASNTAPDNVTSGIDLQEPNPSDNDVGMIAYGTTSAGVNTMEGYETDGSSLTTTTGLTDGSIAVDTTITNWASSYKLAAATYGSSTYYSVAAYSDANDDINWLTMNSAGTWTMQADNLRTRGTIQQLEMFDYPNANKVLLLSADANSDLWADSWAMSTPNSTAWSDITSGGAIETSLATASKKAFDFAFRLSPTTNGTPYGGTAWSIPGTIQAEDYNLGGSGTGYYDSDLTNSGGQYRSDYVDIETTGDASGVYDVGWINADEWLNYTVNVSTEGTYDLKVRIAAATSANFKVMVDNNTVATVPVSSTGGYQNWQTLDVGNLSLTAGTHVLRIYIASGGFNLNYYQFVRNTTTSYLVDFGRSTTQTTTTGWNNVIDPHDISSVFALQKSNGDVTSRTLQLTDGFYYDPAQATDFSSNNNGTTSSTVYPSSATNDSFFLGVLGSVSDTSAALNIGGLNNANTYDFRFYASRVAGDAGNRNTNYTIGATTVTLNATDNVNNYVDITGVSPSSGSIAISVARASGASYGYLGVLEITEHSTANESPVANAGIDQSISLPTTTTTLSGSGSDFDGTIASYAWTFISGPSTPSITSASSASTGVTGLSSVGTYVFRLTVTDNEGATGTDDVNVVINVVTNVSPTANAGTDQNVSMPVSSITLSGSGTDTDGTIASYAWAETSSNYATINSASSATATVADLAAGTYTFRLTVTDNEGATGTDDITVTVGSHANASTAKTIVILGSSTSAGYGISPSSDAYAERFKTYFEGLHAGNSVVNLSVGGYTTYHILPTGTTPPGGRPSPDTAHNITQALTYSPAAILVNMPSNDTANGYSEAEQEANYQALKSAADTAGVPIWFTTTQPRNLAQSGIDEQIAVKDWILSTYGTHAIDFWTTFATVGGTVSSTYDQGDGIHLNNVAHKKLYARVAASSMISNIYNVTPTSNAGVDQSVVSSVTSATLSGSGSDTDGTIVSYAWTFISGPSTPSITSASSASTGVTGLSSVGTYVFRLTVTDDAGATGTDDVSVVVATTLTYLIDFGLSDASYPTTTTGWNNITNPAAGSAVPLVTSTGAASSTTFQITNSFFSFTSECGVYSACANINGTTSSSLYPATATKDSFFLGTFTSTDNSAALNVGGLNNANTYDFRFYASRVAGDAGNRTTNYTIGATTVTLNATDNVDNYVDITGVSPSSGSIAISIAKGAGANFSYLGVLEITESHIVSTDCVSQVSSGTWNTAGTWSCGHVPSDGDDVTISSGDTISMDTNSNALNSLTVNGTLSLDNRTLTSASIVINSGGTFDADSSMSTVTVTGAAGWTNAGTVLSGATTIKLTDSSTSGKTFAGGGATYNTVWFAPGSGTGSLTISGNNTFDLLKDDGNVAHSILFTTGSTQTIWNWGISGNAGNLITISSTTTGTHNLIKAATAGTIRADYLVIQHSVASPSGGWYAGTNSTNSQSVASAGSGWLFTSSSVHRGGGTVRNAGGETDNGTGVGTCADGIKNGNETGVDTGGRCANTGGGTGGGGGTTGGETDNGTGTGTCSDQIKNGNETGVDTGGRCANTGGGTGGGGGGDVGFLFFFQHITLPTMNMWFAFR